MENGFFDSAFGVAGPNDAVNGAGLAGAMQPFAVRRVASSAGLRPCREFRRRMFADEG
jgi:hypothetical protein